MTGVEPPKAPRRELTILSPADWSRVRAYIEQHGESWWLPAFHLAITTGMRRSEIAALRWGDFDPEKGIIAVNRSLHCVKSGELIVREPKTRGSRRAVGLDRGTVNILLDYRKHVERVVDTLGSHMSPERYIFSDLHGKPYRPDSYSQLWRRIRERVGIPNVRLHDLRHSAASLLLANGIPAHVVSERLGHSTVGFTLTVYGHVLPNQQTEAAEQLARLLDGQTGGSASLPSGDMAAS